MPRASQATPPRLRNVTMPREAGSKAAYEEHLTELQKRMLAVQRAVHRHGERGLLVFEGWDAGGKGGSIRRLTEKLDPRGFEAHPIGAPSAAEQGKHYLYRFWARLPAPGKIAIFDRSWYGRVLVERVEGLASTAEVKRAYEEINAFEKMLLDDGARLVKIFLHITPEEQARRFLERLKNPYKRWKLTEEDLRNRARWDEYEEATDDMLAATSTPDAPWTVIGGDHKWTARLSVLRTVIDGLSEGLDLTMPKVRPAIRAEAERVLGVDLRNIEAEEPGEESTKKDKDKDKDKGKSKSKKGRS